MFENYQKNDGFEPLEHSKDDTTELNKEGTKRDQNLLGKIWEIVMSLWLSDCHLDQHRSKPNPEKVRLYDLVHSFLPRHGLGACPMSTVASLPSNAVTQ